MSYQKHNQAKANFNNVYNAPTPHNYFELMDSLDYRIGEEARPYFCAAVELLRRQNPRQRVQMLDLGCSYGVGSALVKHRFSFDRIVDFFQNQASRDYSQCVEETRQWLEEEVDAPLPIKCVGVDCSEEAVQFAEEADLLDAGIPKNFEEGEKAAENEVQLIRQCNLMTSTGAIGYITDKTLDVVLSHLGKSLAEQRGPYIVVTILRMFDSAPIKRTFEKFGFRFEQVPGVRLRQRHFATQSEQDKTVRLLRDGGVNPNGWEAEGSLYADLFAAAPAADFQALADALLETRARLKDEDEDEGEGASEAEEEATLEP